MAAGQGPGPSVGRRLVYGLTLAAIVFGLLEVALRVAGVGSGAAYVVRPGLRWAMEPNLNKAVTNMVGGRVFYMTTNEDGLRTEWTRGHAPEGMKTILWLGDSRIVGWGVEDGQDAPTALEWVLSQRFPATPVRVINAGSPGYSSVQSAVLLQEIGVNYDPDLVIFEIAGHNLRVSSVTDRQSVDPSGASAVTWFLTGHLRSYRLLRRLVLSANTEAEGQLFLGDLIQPSGQPDADSDEVRVPPADLAVVLRSAAELGEREGFRVVATFPCNAKEVPPRHLAVVQELANEGVIGFVDYATPFSARGGLSSDYALYDSPGHHTADGNYLAAEAMADVLAQGGFVP